MTPDEFQAYRYHYQGTVAEIHDGDTARISLDLGLEVCAQPWIRFLGYNAPELTGATKAAGLAARDYLTTLLAGQTLYLDTKKPAGSAEEERSFARWLARVSIVQNGQLVDVSGLMIASGHAVYDPGP